jgi:hypothetical protein
MQGVIVARPSNFADFNAQSSTTTTQFCRTKIGKKKGKNLFAFFWY